jgi:hypothetical protein
MAKLTIKEVGEEKIVAGDKRLREVSVNKDGMDWNFDRVTIWGDHPAYDVLAVGLELNNSHVQATPQATINEKTGKPYNNYTLREGLESTQTAPIASKLDDAKLDAIYALLKEIHTKVFGEQKTANETSYEANTGKPYPTYEVTEEELEDPSKIAF